MDSQNLKKYLQELQSTCTDFNPIGTDLVGSDIFPKKPRHLKFTYVTIIQI